MGHNLTLIHGGNAPAPSTRTVVELPRWFSEDHRVSMRRKIRARIAERAAPTITIAQGTPAPDLIRHREEYNNFRFEVWQSGKTVFTERPLFYTLRWNLITRSRPRPRREDHFTSTEHAIRETKAIIDRQRMFLGNEPASPRRRRKKRSYAIRPDEQHLIEYITDAAEQWEPGAMIAFVPPDPTLPADVLAAIANQ